MLLLEGCYQLLLIFLPVGGQIDVRLGACSTKQAHISGTWFFVCVMPKPEEHQVLNVPPLPGHAEHLPIPILWRVGV